MDQQMFGERVRACQTKLYRVSLSIMGAYADAEDAAADAVMKAWEKRDGLREEKYFETWLIRILINTCREHLRRRRSHPTEELNEHLRAAEPERYDSLHAALAKIDEKYRLPLVMFRALDMTVKEVALALKLPTGVVRWRIDKGRMLARTEIEKEEGEA